MGGAGIRGIAELFCLLAQASLPPDPPADPFEVTLEARVLWAQAWGSASAHNSFTQYQRGESLDLRDDFGLTQGAALADLDLSVRFADRHRLGIGALSGTFSGHTTLDRTFEYNDNVFQAGESARTSLEIDIRDATYDYRILDDGGTTLWIGGGLRRVVLNVGLESTTLDPQGSMEDNKALFATLHAALQHEIAPSLRLGFEMLGAPAAIPALFSRPSLGRFIQARASIAWEVVGGVTLDAGLDLLWMWQDCEAREPDQHYAVNRVELLLLGPSLGLRIAF